MLCGLGEGGAGFEGVVEAWKMESPPRKVFKDRAALDEA
jgi:hypothetical protein